mmetsp:Transcript_19896/g.47485  ORF Transcript_19896/g.47485 Transcript_19896/m.47485 type:complete len:193 (-) Transcript_19896:54-632(-)
MEILRTRPDATLRLQECIEDARLNIKAEAEARGVSQDRLIISEKLKDYYEHMEFAAQCHLFLDTPKYNAHTSAADVLYGGVPTITLPGELMVTRGAASLVHSAFNSGGADTIARTIDDYHEIALRLAHNERNLERVRGNLRRSKSTARLFDTERWVCAWERALKMLYDSYPRTDDGSGWHVSTFDCPLKTES